ncbi:MAG: divalent-cation tolerance protein CutA [Acidobacteriia bacterium]|nr:divalent-cation tolerance protein CutA [Terriglobia bacterium]
MTDKIIVFVTAGKITEAKRIARRLVEKRLAACVSVIPKITSVYTWKNRVETQEECLLLIKTRRQRFDELRQCIESLHSYEVPEIIAAPIVEGAANYLNWIEQVVPAEG